VSTSLREELYATSRAVLVGVRDYERPAFPPILEAERSLRSLRGQLRPQWPVSRITIVTDPRTPQELEDELRRAAQGVTGVLLVYYLGYAVVGADQRPWLTTTSSRLDQPDSTALPWDAVSAILGDTCPARARAVLLDLRLAGPGARAVLERGAGPALARLTRIEDGSTLVAVTQPRGGSEADLGAEWSRHRGSAWRRTDLVEHLYRTARAADPVGPPWLTLAELAGPLHDAMLARDLPVPGFGGIEAAGRFPFRTRLKARLPAARTAERRGRPQVQYKPEPEFEDWVDPRLLDPVRKAAEGERVARTIGSVTDRAVALAEVAAAVAQFDPRRAATLFAEAEVCAFFGSPIPFRWRTVSGIANAMADSDPVHAERVLRSTAAPTSRADRAEIGCAFVAALGVRHPGHAESFALAEPDVELRVELFFALAERRAAEDPYAAVRIAAAQPSGVRAQALRLSLVSRLVDADVTAAERVARTIKDPKLRAEAQAVVARAIVATEPRRAARLVRKAARAARVRRSTGAQAPLVRVLALATGIDLPWAEGVARSLPREAGRDTVFEAMAVELAVVDRACAVRMTGLIEGEWSRDRALTKVAERVAASDPDFAVRMARSLHRDEDVGRAWRAVVIAAAATDAAKAERILRSTDGTRYPIAAVYVAEAMAGRDPWRAERVARSIRSSGPEGMWKDEALAAVAVGWARLARAAPTSASAALDADAAAVRDAIPAQATSSGGLL
jgi:hypothetical protein